MTDPNEIFMRMALNEAKIAYDKDETPIGAVVVSHGRVIAKAHNQVELLNDATAHAEMLAVTAASNALGSKYLTDCAIYVTIEPCQMCAAALYWAKIGALFVGAADNRFGYSQFNNQMFTDKTFVEQGILENECAQLMQDFFQKKRALDKLK